MAERDTNKEALEHVEKATESEPVKGEDLVESEDPQAQVPRGQGTVTRANRRATDLAAWKDSVRVSSTASRSFP